MVLGRRAGPVLEVDNFNAICEPTVYIMWDPQYFTTLNASTACYGDSFMSLNVDDALTAQETHARLYGLLQG
jgi:hypothetical protein